MTLTCDKCEKTFERKDLYARHLARKTPCSKAEGYPCKECPKKFSTRNKLHSHIENDHGITAQTTDAKEATPTKEDQAASAMASLSRTESVCTLRDRMQNVTLPSAVEVPQDAVGNPFRPLSFGKERQDYLDDMSYDEMKKKLKLTPTLETLFAMIKLININPSVPENRNIFLRNVDDDHILLFHRGQWNTVEIRETVMNLIGRNRLRFYDIEATLGKNMRRKALQSLDEYLDDIEEVANGNVSPGEDFETLIDDIKEELAKVSINEKYPAP